MRVRVLGLAVAVAVLLLAAVVTGWKALGTTSAGPVATHTGATDWTEVAPILANHCISCHTAGGIAPFALTSATAARAHAQEIVRATRSGAMPPWMPGTDSPPYAGQDLRILSPAEKQTLAAWVAAGAPTGTGAMPAAPDTGSHAAGRVVELAPPAPYTPKASGGALDDYHCFLLEPGLAKDAFVTSALVEPGTPSTVHHVILFEAAGDQATEARRLNAASGGKGWTCFGGPGIGEQSGNGSTASSDALGSAPWISAWAPGQRSGDLPAGTGVLLHAGSAVVMQVHYNLIHGAKTDRSRAVLRLVDADGTDLTALHTILVAAPVELPCPPPARRAACSRSQALTDVARKYGRNAGVIPLGLLLLCRKTLADYPQSPHTVTSLKTSCERRVTRPLRIYGVAGHMHLRGVDISVWLNPGTPSERLLLHIPHWNFPWQGAYYLQQPADAEPGDTVGVKCSFDNSARKQPELPGMPGMHSAPRYVVWGEGTTDEMCLGMIQAANR